MIEGLSDNATPDLKSCTGQTIMLGNIVSRLAMLTC